MNEQTGTRRDLFRHLTGLGINARRSLATATGATQLNIVGPKTTNYNIEADDDIVLTDDSSTNVVIFLPDANGQLGRRLSIVKTNTYNGTRQVVIEAQPGQTISGQSWRLLYARGECLTVVSDGANWHTIDGNQPLWRSSHDLYVGNVDKPGDGRSPAAAFTTFAEAAAATGSGTTIHLCGNISETCTLPSGAILDAHGYLIEAPSDTADCLRLIGANGSKVRNLTTSGYGPNWTGSGIYMEDSSHCRVDDWLHGNSGHSPTAELGGNGLFANHGEGNLFVKTYIEHAAIALNIAEEFTGNTFIVIHGSGNYMELYANGVFTRGLPAHSSAGGNNIYRYKATDSLTPGKAVWFQNNIHGGGPPNNWVIDHADWSESATPNTVQIDSDVYDCTFRNPASAPSTTWIDDSADGNLYENAVAYGPPFRINGASQMLPDLLSISPPAAGAHYVGRRAWNKEPATGSPAGWICTAAGSPGTWKAMGNLGENVANFGNTANGTHPDNGWRHYAGVSPFAVPTSRTLTGMELWLTPVTSDQTVILAIWEYLNGLPDLGALLAQTGPLTAPIAAGTQKVAGSLITPLVAASGQLIGMGFVSTSPSGNINLMGVSGGSLRFRNTNTVNNPFGVSGSASSSYSLPIAAI